MVQKIGQGSFGKVYSAYDMSDETKNLSIAVKTEPLQQAFSHLLKEIQSVKALEGPAFGNLLSQGISVENNIIYMVTPLLGPSLEDVFQLCEQRFSLKTTLMVFL